MERRPSAPACAERAKPKILVELDLSDVDAACDPCAGFSIEPPFVPGDRVSYCGPTATASCSHYSFLQNAGTVQWCRLSRVGANPPDWTVGVTWDYAEGYTPRYSEGVRRARYLARNICRLEPSPAPRLREPPTRRPDQIETVDRVIAECRVIDSLGYAATWPARPEDALRWEDV